MFLRVEVDAELAAQLEEMLSFYGLKPVAAGQEDEYLVLYFDVPLRAGYFTIMGKNDWDNAFVKEMEQLRKRAHHLNVSFSEEEEPMGLPSFSKVNFDEVLVEVRLPRGRLYPLEAEVPVEVSMTNKLDREITALVEYQTLFGVAVEDMDREEFAFFHGEKLEEPKTLRIKPGEAHKDTIVVKLSLDHSCLTYFVARSLAGTIDAQTTIYYCSPITVIFSSKTMKGRKR